jgi:hypothetical protein
MSTLNYVFIRKVFYTYSGARLNSRAVPRSDITPMKKTTLSRVRTTLAECHVAERELMRDDIFWNNQHPIRTNSDAPRLKIKESHLGFKLAQLALHVLSNYFSGHIELERALCLTSWATSMFL